MNLISWEAGPRYVLSEVIQLRLWRKRPSEIIWREEAIVSWKIAKHARHFGRGKGYKTEQKEKYG